MVQQQRLRVEPGQVVRARVQVRNTGNVPAFLGVRLVSGRVGLFGFAPGGPPVSVTSLQPVRPGETAELRVPIRVPSTAGDAAFLLELGTFDPTGQLSRVLDRRTFNGLAEVLAAIPVVPPGPALIPPAPGPEELAHQFRESLGALALSVNPREINPGQSVRATVQVPNRAPFAFSPQLRLVLLDANNALVRTVFDQRLNVPRGIPIVRQVDINSAGLAAGDYGLRSSLIDPVSNLVLVDPVSLRDAFRIRAATVPAPTVPGVPAVPISSLNLGTVTASPTSVNPGQGVSFNLPLTLLSPPAGAPQPPTPQLVADILVIRSLGGGRFAQAARLLAEQSISLPLPALSWTVPPRTEAGDYGLSLRVWDRRTLVDAGFLVQQQLPNLFRVIALPRRIEPIPEVTPLTVVAGVPAPVGPPAPQLISITAPVLTPATAPPGGAITGEWTLRNPSATPIRAFLFLDGPGGGNGVARDFNLNETVTLRVIGRVPAGQRAGSLTYGLAVRNAGTNTTITGLVRSITLNVPAAPVPAPIPTPPPVSAPTGVGVQPGQLIAELPGAQPLRAPPGSRLTLTFTFRNQSSFSAQLRLLAFPRDGNGRTRGTLQTTVPIAARGVATPSLPFTVPMDAIPGPYELQVFVWDPVTFKGGDVSTYLVRQVYPAVFRVG